MGRGRKKCICWQGSDTTLKRVMYRLSMWWIQPLWTQSGLNSCLIMETLTLLAYIEWGFMVMNLMSPKLSIYDFCLISIVAWRLVLKQLNTSFKLCGLYFDIQMFIQDLCDCFVGMVNCVFLVVHRPQHTIFTCIYDIPKLLIVLFGCEFEKLYALCQHTLFKRGNLYLDSDWRKVNIWFLVLIDWVSIILQT